jgi:hypothetical protein
VGPYLRRGALAGLAGGVAMALFLLIYGERSIRAALAIEEANAGHDHGGGAAPFTRGEQVFGGSMALLIYGLFLGTVFGIVFAAVRHHSRLRDDFWRSLGLGAVAFGTLVLVPALKYPGNPPAVGDPDTVGERTVSYLTLMLAAIVLAVGIWRLSQWLRRQGFEDHLRVPAVAVTYVAALAIVYLVWPSNPDPVEIPAKLIWRFRLAALGGSATLFAVMAATFGWLSVKATAPQPATPARRAAV